MSGGGHYPLSTVYPDLFPARRPGFLSATGTYNRYLVTQSDLLLGARLREQEGEWKPLIEFENDPVGLAKKILGVRLWGKQRKILRALINHPRVSVAACYGSGKTFLAAVAVIWWMLTRDTCKVITTAPTQRQVRDLLWHEIQKLHKNALVRLPGKVLSDRWVIDQERIAKGFTGKGENNVAGIHNPRNIFFIEDEAAGIEARTEAGFAGITIGPGNRRLKIGNPICDSGPFYNTHCHPTISEQWHKETIDALETPNVRGLFRERVDETGNKVYELIIRETRQMVPGLVDAEWVRQKKIEWLDLGIKSHWEQRCRGRFFVTSAQRVVPVEWALASQGRWEFASSVGVRVLGVDIGGGGRDATKVALRTGQRVRIIDGWHTDDHDEQARRISNWANRENVEAVIIDATSIGKAVYLALVKCQESGYLSASVMIIPVYLGSSPTDRETYNSRADEIQFYLRAAMNPNNPEAIALDPSDQQTAAEVCWRSWTTNGRNRVECDSKKDLKEKGYTTSPDSGDAVSMTCVPLPERICLL